MMRALVVLCTVLAIGCGGPSPSPPSVLATAAGEARYSCGDEQSFTADALAAPAGAETADHPAADALRSLLAVERGRGFFPDSGYRLAAQTDDAALFVAPWAGEEDWAYVSVRRDEGGAWSASSWGGCHPERAFTGAGVGTWQLDPAAPPPRPDTTELEVLVSERACASGESSAGRILPPLITEQPEDVILAFAVRPLQVNGAVACPGNPAVPVTVKLPSPLGDRQLLDGAFLAPRPPAAP